MTPVFVVGVDDIVTAVLLVVVIVALLVAFGYETWKNREKE